MSDIREAVDTDHFTKPNGSGRLDTPNGHTSLVQLIVVIDDRTAEVCYPVDHLPLLPDLIREKSQPHATDRKQNQERSKTESQPAVIARCVHWSLPNTRRLADHRADSPKRLQHVDVESYASRDAVAPYLSVDK